MRSIGTDQLKAGLRPYRNHAGFRQSQTIEVSTYENIENGDDIFDLADNIESSIMNAEDSLEKISAFVRNVVECWPDPDEEFEDE